MKKCETVRPLVEKLADGEATSSERAEAEAHLEACGACRAYLWFLRAVEETPRGELSGPPDAYWDELPSRILGRIQAETASDARRSVLTPAVLRLAAVAATIVVVTSIGAVILRNGDVVRETDSTAPYTVTPEKAAPGAEAVTPPPALRHRASREPESAPPHAPSEAFASPESPSELPAPSPKVAAAPERSSLRGVAEAPAQLAAAGVSEIAGADEAPEAETAYRALRRRRDTESCEPWRTYVERYGEGGRGADARYELARCSLESYRDDPSDETRQAAIRDARDFLRVEPEGPRAAEIEDALSELRK